jgi:hypothetical protein
MFILWYLEKEKRRKAELEALYYEEKHRRTLEEPEKSNKKYLDSQTVKPSNNEGWENV